MLMISLFLFFAAKMKPPVGFIVALAYISVVSAQVNLGQGLQREIFFLNLEDGYFGCQVNESTDVLQLFEVSRLCDGTPNCFLGSDENFQELKCTNDCPYTQGYKCVNGACLDGQCHCNDGYGGCGCDPRDY
nr:tenascin-like [Penaeus vannamei]